MSTNHVVFQANRFLRLISLPTSAIFASETSGITAILKYRSVNPIVLVLFLFSISFITIFSVNLCVLVTVFGSTWGWLQKTTNLWPNLTPNSTPEFSLKNRFETITIIFSCQRFVFLKFHLLSTKLSPYDNLPSNQSIGKFFFIKTNPVIK